MIQEVLQAIRDWANPKFKTIADSVGLSTDAATEPTVQGKLSALATKVGDFEDGKTAASLLKNINDTVATVGSLSSEVSAGKPALANAISSKGVKSSINDSLNEMANKVLQIKQKKYLGESDFEAQIAPSDVLFNVYRVAQDLMQYRTTTTTTTTTTFPDWLHDKLNGWGTNAQFVGEYYKGYDTISLEGADGYFTCDNHFYAVTKEADEETGNTLYSIKHTFPDGSEETFDQEEKCVIHTWEDGDDKTNRYVAFFYRSSAWTFSNTKEEICPRDVAICGECLSFVIATGNRLTRVYVLGNLRHFEGGTTGTSWNNTQVIRNYQEHSIGTVYTSATLLSCILSELRTLGGGILLNATNTTALSMPSLQTINGGTLISGGTHQTINLPSLQTINGGTLISGGTHQTINLPSLQNVNGGTLISGGTHQTINLPSLQNVSEGANLIYNAYTPADIYIPDMESISNYLFYGNAQNIGIGGLIANKVKTIYKSPIYAANSTVPSGKDLLCFDKFSRIEMNSLEEVQQPIIDNKNNTGYKNSESAFTSLIELNLPSLKTIKGTNGLIYCSGDAVTSKFLFFSNLKKISLPQLTSCSGYLFYIYAFYSSNRWYCSPFSLEDIEVGEMTTSLDCRYWVPKDVIATTEGIDRINENIRNHIAAKVSDRTGLSALNFTVSSKLYAVLTSATLQAFYDKNWNVNQVNVTGSL